MKKESCKNCKKYLSALIQIAEVLGSPTKKKDGYPDGCPICKCAGCNYEHTEASSLARQAIPENLRKRIGLKKGRRRPIKKGLGHRLVEMKKAAEQAFGLLSDALRDPCSVPLVWKAHDVLNDAIEREE